MVVPAKAGEVDSQLKCNSFEKTSADVCQPRHFLGV
jgi:hypothetical protein